MAGCEQLSAVAGGCLENPTACTNRLPNLPRTAPSLPNLATLGEVPEAISTNFGDARGETPRLDAFAPTRSDFVRLEGLPREADGTYRLLPGLYSLDARGYCLKPGTHGPSRGDGHLSAPLEGPRAEVVQDILRAAPRNREVSQREVQILLWAIIARQSFSDMSERVQRTATTLVPQHRFTLDGGWVGLIPEEQMERIRQAAPEHLRHVYDAEARLRSTLSSPRGGGYDALERIAMLPGQAPQRDVIRHVPTGRWSLHADGYYVRYRPSGYTRMRFEVFVPPPGPLRLDRAGQPALTNQSLNGAVLSPVTFDATRHVIVPAITSGQRLGSDGGVVDSEPDWHTVLPDCPCSPPRDGQLQTDKQAIRGQWTRETSGWFRTRLFGALQDYHPGASTSFRWSSGARDQPHGQQCTYDAEGRLITGGLGAGTPDLFSPDWGVNGFVFHFYNDVYLFGGRLDDTLNETPFSCEAYLRVRPPNGGTCRENTVTLLPPYLGRFMSCRQVIDSGNY